MAQKTMSMSTIEYTEQFCKLLQFYLFDTPVENTSQRGKSFKEIGWNGSSRFQMLERLLKESSSIEDQNWIFTEIEKLEKLTLIQRDDIQYMVSCYDKGRVRTMIYAIRNAFAHGSFSRQKNGWYIFENHYRGRLKARMIISEETLLNWIKLIQSKPEYYTKKKRKKTKNGKAA